MAGPESTRTDGAVNPDTFEAALLDFVECGLAVVPRADLEAVELRARAAGLPDTKIVLARPQAMAVAALLLVAVATVDRE